MNIAAKAAMSFPFLACFRQDLDRYQLIFKTVVRISGRVVSMDDKIKGAVLRLTQRMKTASPQRIAQKMGITIHEDAGLPEAIASVLSYDGFTRVFRLDVRPVIAADEEAMQHTLAVQIAHAVLHIYQSDSRDYEQEKKEAGEFARLLLAASGSEAKT